MIEIPNISSLGSFTIATLLFFAVVIGRYVLIAGLFHLYFYIWKPATWKRRKLGNKPYSSQQYRREIAWSTVTAFIFAIAASVTLVLWQMGYTKIYLDPSTYGYWYLPISLIIYLVLHETYYYWLHRWMHHPRVFSIVHRVHHQSTTTSAWTAFSFHPLEGLLQAIFLPVVLLFIPIHPYVLLTQLTIMTLTSVINHLDIEIYPHRFNKNFAGKWLIGATHHSLHHKQFKYNFGLYFTFWDKIKKTESPRYDALFEEKTIRKEVS